MEPTAVDRWRRRQRLANGQPPQADCRGHRVRPDAGVQQPGQFADVEARDGAAGRLFWPRPELGARLGRADVAKRARTVQPAAALVAGHTRGEPAHPVAPVRPGSATAQSGPVPSERQQVPVQAHEVRPQRPGAHVGRAPRDLDRGRTVAGEPVQLQRVRVEEHVQPVTASPATPDR